MAAEERRFVAVTMPREAREALDAAVAPLREAWPRLRWSRREGWHLTLAFTGAQDPLAVEAATRAAAAAHAPFEVALSGRLGAFGRSVLWAGVEPSEGLEAVAAGLRRELTARGVEVDARPFHAHVTVARAPRRGRVPAAAAWEAWRGPTPAWRVEELVVLRTVGPGRYADVVRAALSG